MSDGLRRAVLVPTFGAALAAALLTGAAGAGNSKSGGEPSGLMVHVPCDGSFVDARGLGAVRPEAIGKPDFLPGMVNEGALPGGTEIEVGQLHVTRLSRLLLRGHTPAAGTIMIWCRLDPGAGDTTTFSVLGSDAPLALAVSIHGAPPAVAAAFTDRAGARHEIVAALPAAADSSAARWVHVALGWDSAAGTVTAFASGQPIARTVGAPYEMAGLPQQFDLGCPRAAIDDFRLYDRLLEPVELATLPGLARR